MLDEIEIEIFEKIMKRCGMEKTNIIAYKKLNTDYIRQGNFTICIICHDRNIITAGVSKRNPIDTYLDSIGENRAFAQALNNLFVRGFEDIYTMR